MQVEAIRYYGYPDKNSPHVYPITFSSAEELQQIHDRTRLGVLVVKNDDIKLFTEFDRAVADNGNKHRAKGLSHHLLYKKKAISDARMPLIRCEFQEPGRVAQSVRTLLEHAADQGERKTYIIGISVSLFEQLKRNLPYNQKPGSSIQYNPIVSGNSSESWSEELLELLKHEEVPKEITNRYLGSSREIKLVHQLILRAAKLDQPVLLVGESGTGKELVAWSIHEQSKRRNGPFRAVNCGAIPSELFEAELFGTTKNAFTGAADKEGLWKQADHGTLFLDEIADLSPAHQVKILRSMQEQIIRRVGGLDEEPVNTRIIAATNRNLSSMVQSGDFREDLFYRIHGFVIYTPSLRSHPEDIPQMAIKFWEEITGQSSPGLSSEILTELQNRRWLGNGRELKMFLGALYGLFGNKKLSVRHLRAVNGLPGLQRDPALKPNQSLDILRADQLRHYKKILEVLNSLRLSMSPAIEENQLDTRTVTLLRVVLESYLEKLSALTDRQELFLSNDGREAVNQFIHLLTGFAKILSVSGQQAREKWQKDIYPTYQKVDRLCFSEIQKLLDGVVS